VLTRINKKELLQLNILGNSMEENRRTIAETRTIQWSIHSHYYYILNKINIVVYD